MGSRISQRSNSMTDADENTLVHILRSHGLYEEVMNVRTTEYTTEDHR